MQEVWSGHGYYYTTAAPSAKLNGAEKNVKLFVLKKFRKKTRLAVVRIKIGMIVGNEATNLKIAQSKDEEGRKTLLSYNIGNRAPFRDQGLRLAKEGKRLPLSSSGSPSS